MIIPNELIQAVQVELSRVHRDFAVTCLRRPGDFPIQKSRTLTTAVEYWAKPKEGQLTFPWLVVKSWHTSGSPSTQGDFPRPVSQNNCQYKSLMKISFWNSRIYLWQWWCKTFMLLSWNSQQLIFSMAICAQCPDLLDKPCWQIVDSTNSCQTKPPWSWLKAWGLQALHQRFDAAISTSRL